MSANSPIGRAVVVGLVMPLVLACGLISFGQGNGRRQQGAAPTQLPGETAPPSADLQTYITGAERCNQCHSDKDRWAKMKKSKPLICDMDEFPVWDKHDKHKNALKYLASDRGKRMGQLLGIEDVTKSSACLNCHGVAIPDGDEAGRTQNFNQIEEGVTCVACHGPYNEWVTEHVAQGAPKWRNLSRAQKQTDKGMFDLWNPVTRTQKCLSCHIGNASEGKVVTHSMYAAGHPPLPSIEVATFSDAQPRHWNYLREKPKDVQKEQGYATGTLEQTSLVAVTGLVGLRESLRLFADQASAGGLVKEPPTSWPDFARYDCNACHHDLQAPGYLGWRQQRGFLAEPGRPQTPTWPTALVELGLIATNPDGAKAQTDELETKYRAFHAALGARPYGDTPRAISAARDVVATIDGALKGFDQSKVDRGVALTLLRKIAELGQTEIVDFDTARQFFWSFRVIYDEIAPKADDPVVATLKALDDRLGFSLPSAGEQTSIEETLVKRMTSPSSYDPSTFRSAFAELSRLLPAE